MEWCMTNQFQFTINVFWVWNKCNTNRGLLDNQLDFFNDITDCFQFISDCLDKIVMHETQWTHLGIQAIWACWQPVCTYLHQHHTLPGYTQIHARILQCLSIYQHLYLGNSIERCDISILETSLKQICLNTIRLKNIPFYLLNYSIKITNCDNF